MTPPDAAQPDPSVQHVVEVDRGDPSQTRVVEVPVGPLGDGQVRLRVDRLALTANTVTYAVAGGLLGYWDFFPTGDARWGRVPAMGWADVVESAHPDVVAGGRYYGWFPMAGFVDLTVTPTGDGLRDDGDHRSAHASVYRSYVDTRVDPLYPRTGQADGDGEAGAGTAAGAGAGSATAPDLGELEDRHALLRGLFLTGFLADEFFAADDYFGAEAVVVLSASSKTAIAFAQRAALRGIDVVGVTSAANADFVRSLGFYGSVVTYDQVGDLEQRPTVSIDMAGSRAVLAALHGRLGDHLAHSMIIGASHHDGSQDEISGGPTPEFFFAPTEVARRVQEWGRDEFQRRSAEALRAFVADSTRWLEVERATGPEATDEVWHRVHDGAVAPSTGCIVSLHP